MATLPWIHGQKGEVEVFSTSPGDDTFGINIVKCLLHIGVDRSLWINMRHESNLFTKNFAKAAAVRTKK